MNAQDAKILRTLSEFTHEKYRNLKRQWQALPAKRKARERRKILAFIEERREQQALRVEKFQHLPRKL